MEIGDGKIEGLSAIGGGGQAAISFMPDADEHPLASLKVHSLIFVGDLQYWWTQLVPWMKKKDENTQKGKP